MPKVNTHNDTAIAELKERALLVSKTLAEVAKFIRPGVSTLELDRIAEAFIRDNGAEPAFKGYTPAGHTPFPGTLCTSLNDVVVHGIPSETVVLEDGDLISVDVGVYYDGYYGDSAYTFGVGNISEDKRRLMEATKKSLELAAAEAVHGNRLGDIGNACQSFIHDYGFGIVKEMVGHGIGQNLHEPPEVPNYGRRGNGPKLVDGMVICIEPMINFGTPSIAVEKDGWTIRSRDNSPSAHYEYMVAIRKGEPEILTTFQPIEEQILVNG